VCWQLNGGFSAGFMTIKGYKFPPDFM